MHNALNELKEELNWEIMCIKDFIMIILYSTRNI